ncbi:MAG: ribosome-associated translation inhibitor RaiA [Dysgonamonadaceae bacterium]|jgi:putative sigma-54 modulation protein|nr:ribosome-associated translation inhibitor RaiA [Dysgonamonadaceae bacterium]MDD3355919.1 ribosome-associated translation inhibitor RaiA [Dysgonamonadaceae bacterium]MDD3727002.1 ribosome-associated translation inhibitor RaiA [Dysgonamonadaceae bacterium]MDD4245871.1 ribosome-associated translation inhibitor RaiA [Dysgonamonadaceae bacterium]MDD4605091.1 ribosome-associated translation inhibitor RaiA [Dysgonamonadaceae bacterium]
MELRIQSVNFDASDKLKAFAEKKAKKLVKYSDDIIQSEMIMKLVKPEGPNNKEVSMKLNIRNGESFASKTADTFEEAIDLCMDALEKQLIRTKEKKSGK